MSPVFFALAAVLAPALLIPFVRSLPRQEARWLAVAASASSAALSAGAAVGYLLDPSASRLWIGAAAFHVDGLAATVAPAIGVVGLGLVLAAPRSELDGRYLVGVLGMVSAGIGALVAGNVVTLVAFEVVSVLTLCLVLRGRQGGRLAMGTLGASAAVWVGAAVYAGRGALAPWGASDGLESLPVGVLSALLVSVLGRLAVTPLGTWAAAAAQSRRPLHALPGLLPLGGMALAARWLHPQLDGVLGPDGESTLTAALLLLALITVGLALVQKDGLVALSRTLAAVQALVLVAVLDPEPLGHLGGQLMWGASLVAGAGFSLTVFGAHARIGRLNLDRFSGLDSGAPRLGLSCLLFGLALAGLPGSVDFIAQELLLNAGIGHSVVGLALAAAVAAGLGLQNLRVFFRLFYGPALSDGGLDMKPREVAAVVPLVVLLVVGGVAPGLVPLLRSAQHQAPMQGAAHSVSLSGQDAP